jgi:hypothetical protein
MATPAVMTANGTFCPVRFGAPKRETGHSDHIYVMSAAALHICRLSWRTSIPEAAIRSSPY